MSENIFIGLANNAAILMALGLIYDSIFRKKHISSSTYYQMASGLIIGIMAIVLMATPVRWESNIIFDTRTILLGLTGLFFGAIPTFTAIIIAGAYRLSIGGIGASMGVATIVSSALIGLIWRHYRFSRSQLLSIKELYLFGVVVHITMILCIFLLPQEFIGKFLKSMATPVIIIYPIVTVLLGILLANKRRQMLIEDELRESENMLNEANARHAAMIENIGDVISIVRADGVLTYISPNSEKLSGATPEELLETSAWNRVHPDDLMRIQNDFKNLLKDDNAIKTTEYRNKCKDGTYKWVEITAVNRIKNTAINGILLNYHDINERKQAEFALAADAVTLRSIGDGVITTDMQGNVIMLNKAAENLTGWKSDEAAGHPLPDVFNIINEITRKKCENPVEQVLATSGTIKLANHTCLISKNGREIIIADSGAPIRDAEGKIIGVVLVFRDMTEKQKLDESIQKTQKLESLGILAGGIAHDFNNLLGGIFGYIELALQESTETNVSTYLAESLSNVERARALTQQLLTFAKGGAPIKKLETLFPFVDETVQFALSGTSVSSISDVQEGLWLCEFDKNQIAQVIDNISINAQQAMPNGGTIEVSAKNVIFEEHSHPSLAAGKYIKLSFKRPWYRYTKRVFSSNL
jgi:PAS domain S-box-containing protein